MSRLELMRALRARGAAVPPHTIEYLAQQGRLDPPPRLDGSHRRVYAPEHVDQVLAHVRRGRRTGQGVA
ncbi:MAG: MerR family transcriptional regulator [Planctomycetota bacterium]|nr:MerR family transcriptional regulator [Planctomycetota bacterium]